ncbi:MAG TPA: pirin family protein [Acidimicrobiia bacterium]|nr:pirin family protein [Acidimicrobiia bacterium]
MSAIADLVQLGFPWDGYDPFLFTVHHVDHYPAGNDRLGPVADLVGRNIGSDFSYRDGWSMYHGGTVPGFPQHPHRGFETVTVVRRGFVDHSDSLGATARYGEGDVQWLTTGSGIMHSEMFPLLDADGDNPLELFQIWLNLPPESKMVEPYFGMLWSEAIPSISPAAGVSIDAIAGRLGSSVPPSPPPDSWASRPDTDFAIWLIRLGPGAVYELPPAEAVGTNRTLYCFMGDDLTIDGTSISADVGARLRAGSKATLENHGAPAEFLMLQGRPIGAPVFQMGPFVMNSAEELRQAVDDYRRTQFGGWPWSGPDPVHAREEGRFALHADGRVEHRDREQV